MAQSNRPRKYVQAYELNPNFVKGQYKYEKFGDVQPVLFTHASNITALPTAAQAQVDWMLTKNYWFEMYQSTAQTLMPTVDTSKGLEIALDQVNNESVEYVPGGNSARSEFAKTIGTSLDFQMKAKFRIDDVSGTDQFFFGFRKQEAFAVPTSFLSTGDGIYTDFAGFLVSAGDVNTATDLNNGGSTTVTDTLFNWADNEVHELQIRVIGGRAYYFINGVRLGNPIAKDGDGTAITSQSTNTGASFTFDTADVVIPTIFCRQDADLTPIFLRELWIGDLIHDGLDKNAE